MKSIYFFSAACLLKVLHFGELNERCRFKTSFYFSSFFSATLASSSLNYEFCDIKEFGDGRSNPLGIYGTVIV